MTITLTNIEEEQLIWKHRFNNSLKELKNYQRKKTLDDYKKSIIDILDQWIYTNSE